MGKYILKRFIYSILTIWVIITVTFFLMHLIPGGPFDAIGNKKLPPEVVKNLNAQYHLDKPLFEQYAIYLKGVVTRFDLGQSMRENRTVNEVIQAQFPASATLGLESIIIAAILGLILGIITALRKNSAVDYIISGITVFFISIPAYVIALFLQYFLAFKLTTVYNVTIFPISGWDSFASTVLPSLAIALPMMVSITKYMKSSMVDVINQDYIKTARAKGISNVAIVWKHTVRNAILPVVTILGPMLVGIIMGTVIIEMIFGIPGIGGYFVNCIRNKDYTMIMGTTIFYSIFLVFTNFIVDLLYGVIDPRIRVAGGR